MNSQNKLPTFGYRQGADFTICVGRPKSSVTVEVGWWKRLLRALGLAAASAIVDHGKNHTKRTVISADRDQGALFQPELGLQKLRVVRNDLSDTDVEVVAGKTEPSLLWSRRIPKAVSSKPSKVANHGRWSRLSGKLFAVGRAPVP